MNNLLIPFIIFIIVFWIAALIYYFVYHKKTRNCTVKVKACITDMEVRTDPIEISTGDSANYIVNDAHYPTYEYEYNGQKYSSKSSLFPSWSNKDLNIGSYEDVYINPDNPNEFFSASIKKLVIFKCIAFVVLPTLFALMMIIFGGILK